MTTTDPIKALRDALTDVREMHIGTLLKPIHFNAITERIDKAIAMTADASEDAPRKITYCEEEWITKTDWVQTDFQKDLFPLAYLGQHRADIMRDEIARLRRVIDHSVPVAEQSTSQSDGAPNNVRQASVVATPAPYAYSYEIRQPFTDGKIWAEFIHRHEGKIPAEGDFIRNIKPLYLGAAASAAPIAKMTRPRLDTIEFTSLLNEWRCGYQYGPTTRTAEAFAALIEHVTEWADRRYPAAEHAKPEPVKATADRLIPVSNVSSFVSFANKRGLSGESWNLAMAAFEAGQQAGAVDGGVEGRVDTPASADSAAGFDCGCQVNDTGELVLCGPCEVELSASAEDAVDAKRYRYLRDAIPSHMRMWVAMGIPGQGCSWWHGEKLDTRIDLEIAQKVELCR